MKTILLKVGDKWEPGMCFGENGDNSCAFAGMGCSSRIPARCPLAGARLAVKIKVVGDIKKEGDIYAVRVKP